MLSTLHKTASAPGHIHLQGVSDGQGSHPAAVLCAQRYPSDVCSATALPCSPRQGRLAQEELVVTLCSVSGRPGAVDLACKGLKLQAYLSTTAASKQGVPGKMYGTCSSAACAAECRLSQAPVFLSG